MQTWESRACSSVSAEEACGKPRTARRPTNTSRLRVNADSARLGFGALGSYLGVILACVTRTKSSAIGEMGLNQPRTAATSTPNP